MNEIQRLIHEMCPNGVPMVALGNVCSDIFSGATPSTTKEEYWENGVIPWMSSGEVHQGTVSFVEKKSQNSVMILVQPKWFLLVL